MEWVKSVKSVNGYARTDGRVGVRNHLLVLPSVICSSVVCERIAEQIPGAVTIPHPNGCSQVGQDAEQTFRVLLGFANSPNVGAVVIVSLGCEVVNATDLRTNVQTSGKPVVHVGIQDVGGSISAIAEGSALAHDLSEDLATLMRTARLNRPCVALKWGDGHSGYSGSTTYIERFIDDVLAAGGIVLLGESEKLLRGVEQGCVTLSESQHKQLNEWVLRRRSSLIDVMEMSAPSSDNTDDFTTFDHAYPNVSQQVVQDLLPYGQTPTEPGLYLMDSPVHDAECLTGFAAAGANIVLYFSDHGSSIGNPIVPVVKLSPMDAAGWDDHIDLRLPDTFDEGALEMIRAYVTDVLGGSLTMAEWLGHTEFAIHRIGLSL